jgi:glycosyltransferase involved in cell wall biosynthesis
MAMHAPDSTIVVSRSLAEELTGKYGGQVHYIPNGITLEPAEDTSILDELALEPRKYVLFASRLVPEKGAHYLVEAWNRQTRDMTLVIAGDSSFSADYVQQLRSSCRQHCVVFPGFVYGARLGALFRNAALFVLPSDVEGLPIVLLEALGYGTPVLASDIPPNREVLGDLGLTFAAGSVDDLRQQLDRALDDLPALHEQARVAAASVLAAYDWEAVTDKTVAVYEASLAARRAGRRGHTGTPDLGP